MEPGKPSRTALGAASHRAAHQVLEGGRIFADPLALRILGDGAEAAVQAARDDPSRRALRLFIAVRSRFAEDALAAAAAGGLDQVVVLGAGLDTFACRTNLAGLRIFEVDHPETQAWKRRMLAEAGIPEPPWLTFAPVDFEHGTLAGGLAAAGFDPCATSFFSWLGVVPYLSGPAVEATLRAIAGLPGGAQVVFDYGNPPGPGPDAYSEAREQLADRVAALGEAIRTHFETAELHAQLAALGFREIEDLGPAQIRDRYFPGRGGGLSDRGGHIVRART